MQVSWVLFEICNWHGASGPPGCIGVWKRARRWRGWWCVDEGARAIHVVAERPRPRRKEDRTPSSFHAERPAARFPGLRHRAEPFSWHARRIHRRRDTDERHKTGALPLLASSRYQTVIYMYTHPPPTRPPTKLRRRPCQSVSCHW